MTKNPIINALTAVGYIVFVGAMMFYSQRLEIREPWVLIPIAMISLLTLSVAMMGYIFLFQPLQMYLDGAKKEGAELFVKTLAVFAVITVLIFFSLLLF